MFDKLGTVLKFLKLSSTRQLIGIKDIKSYSLELANGDALLYYKIQPTNINTLPTEVLATKINNLMTVLKSITEIEISCFNTAENFKGIMEYLKKRLEAEPEQNIKALLQLDILHLEEIKRQVATAKDFLITIRFNIKEKDQLEAAVHRIEKTIQDNGFYPKLLTKEDLKRAIAIYLTQSKSDEAFSDIDGGGNVHIE